MMDSILLLRFSRSVGASPWHCLSFATYVKPSQPKPGSAAKKKGKGDEDLAPKLQRIVNMLLPRDQQQGGGGQPVVDNVQAFDKKEEEYEGRVAAARRAWAADMEAKFQLQRAAIRALPPDLRAKAEVVDFEDFPPNRQYLFGSPPESYREQGKQDGQEEKSGRTKANALRIGGAAAAEK